MKVQYLVLLVVVALEAGLSIWPESLVLAADGAETVVVKPIKRKGKSPKKIRRTIKVREAVPPSPLLASAPAVAAPAAPAAAAVQPPAPQLAQPINNEIHVKPDISVQVSPQQDQQHHAPQHHQQQAPPQQQPSFHVVAPTSGQQPLLIQQKPQQKPIVELPDNDDDDDADDDGDKDKGKNDDDVEVDVKPIDVDDDDDDDVPQVKAANNMQIVPYQTPEQQIVPHKLGASELISSPVSQLIKATETADETINKILMKPAANSLLAVTDPLINNSNSGSALLQPIGGGDDGELVQIDGAALASDSQARRGALVNMLDANTNRYTPTLGWRSPSSYLPTMGNVYGVPLQAPGQLPMIQVNIDEQVRQPLAWSAAPYVASAPAAAAAMWPQQPAAFYAAPPAGAALQPAASLYQPSVYPAPLFDAAAVQPRVIRTSYYGGAAIGQPLVQAAPLVMPQPQPIMMQPIMMQQPVIYKKRSRKQKKRKAPKEVVVEVEEPVVEEKTTWVKKEPQFNQFVEEKPKAVVVEEPEEIEWETVRIPKVKKNGAAAAAAAAPVAADKQ